MLFHWPIKKEVEAKQTENSSLIYRKTKQKQTMMKKAETERVGEACLRKNMKSSVLVLSQGFIITSKIMSTEKGTLTFCFLSVYFVWPVVCPLTDLFKTPKCFIKALEWLTG